MREILLAALLVIALVIAWLLWEIHSKLDALIDVQIQRLDATAFERKDATPRAPRG